MRMRIALLAHVIGFVFFSQCVSAQKAPCEVYTLSNGLTVILAPDRRTPQVVVNIWYGVGSRDEAPGRSGFAHLFEHLMFMGTERVPGNQFDALMESGGGWNNASTSPDRTDYFSSGPSSLLPTLLWLDADRMEGLGKAMTQAKLDLQRDVVRNERRENYENEPYGKARLALPEALYPEGHPYRHPVIGNHEDLVSANLQDVKAFFAAFYVPANASLVVAGDFQAGEVKPLIEHIFGAVPSADAPPRRGIPPAKLDREVRRLLVDRVENPRLTLAWPSPAGYAEGDAALTVAAGVLALESSGRLHERLVLRERAARHVTAYQASRECGSEFTIEDTAAPGTDLERIKRAVLEEVARLAAEGPSESEVRRVQARYESAYLQQAESLVRRAELLNEYYWAFGDPDGFARDLKRYTSCTAVEVREWARRTLGEGRVDLRILPEGAGATAAALDQRPKDLSPAAFAFPDAKRLTLENGVPLCTVSRPGTGLFSLWLLFDGGERRVPREKAGLSVLASSMLAAGAGGLEAAAFSDAVTAEGARLEPGANWHELYVSLDGLTSHLDRSLDLLADAVLRPNLRAEDFEREKALLLASIKARTQDPDTVARIATRALLFGREDVRGRPNGGDLQTVERIRLEDVKEALPQLASRAGARFVFAGDAEPAAVKAALDKRFGAWRGDAPPPPPLPLALEKAPGRMALVERPGAPQTLIYIVKPLPPPSLSQRVARECLSSLFGGTFTSRLMQNIRERHGYAYGARSWILQEANQPTLRASAPVQTAVTGAALREFKREFDALASGDVRPEEMEKAVRSVRFEYVTAAETTDQVATHFAELLEADKPLDSARREIEALDAVSLEGLRGEARSGLFAWDSLLVVLVGDKDAVLPQLKAEGFPAPALVDPEGRPL